MPLPSDLIDGLALAAVVLEDRTLERAGEALAEPLARAARNRLAALEPVHREERVRVLRSLTRSLRPVPAEDAPLPPRARALIAADAPRALARHWLAEAPAPPAGFVPDPGLRSLLRRLAARGASEGAAQREIAALQEAGWDG